VFVYKRTAKPQPGGGGGGRRKAPEKETLIYKKRPEEIPQLKVKLKATNH